MTMSRGRFFDFLIVISIATVFYYMVSVFKYAAGSDERYFFSLGTHFLLTGEYLSAKHHPLYAIFISLPSLMGLNALAAAKIAFVISGAILWVSIYSIFLLVESKSSHSRLFQTIFVGTVPGASSLILYSGSSLLYLSMAAASIALTMHSLARGSLFLYIVCGVFYGLSYLTRLDGLILFVLMGTYMVLRGGTRINRQHLLLIAFGFLVTILPWHLYLYNNQLYFSTVIQGGWGSSVWIDGPMKYIVAANGEFLFSAENLSNILSAFSKNVLLYSQHIGSLRVFPFFYMVLIGFVFLSKELLSRVVYICFPIVATLPYLLFYVEARYLAPAALFLAVLAVIGLNNVPSITQIRSSYIYIFLIGINLLLVISYLLFGHETYSSYQ